jgi:oligopeptide transport system substrate-binding protein
MRHGQVPMIWRCRIACLGLSLLLLSACSLDVLSPQGPLPPSRQVLRLGLDEYFEVSHNLDPTQAQSLYSDPAFLVFPPLLTIDNQLNPEPWAATGLPTFDPRTNTYTFTIRASLRWSDGTPIDANTYAYSLNRSLNPCAGAYSASYLYPIKGAQAFSSENCGSDHRTIEGKLQTLIGDSLRVPNSRTLIIQLTAPAPYLLSALTTSIALAQPEQLIERYGDQGWTQHLTGNGGFGGNLYRVKSVTTEQGGRTDLDLVACLSHCGLPSGWGTHQSAPLLRELDFHYYARIGDEQAEYQKGDLDVEAFPFATTRDASKSSPSLQITSLQLNWATPPFTDLRARQAFARALNRDTLANILNILPTNHIVPAGMTGYDPHLLGPGETVGYTGNVTVARQLLQSYADDACHGQFSRCPPVTVWCSYEACGFGTNPENQMILNYESKAIQMWQQAFPGYPIKDPFLGCADCLQLIPIPIADMHQIFTGIWTAEYADPQDWLSQQFSPTGINNWGNVNDPTANMLMAEADRTLDPAERTALYNQAEQLLVTNVAWIPIGQSLTYYAAYSTVAGFAVSGLGYPSFDQWYRIQLMYK